MMVESKDSVTGLESCVCHQLCELEQATSSLWALVIHLQNVENDRAL